jgi:hypothetical protein
MVNCNLKLYLMVLGVDDVDDRDKLISVWNDYFIEENCDKFNVRVSLV